MGTTKKERLCIIHKQNIPVFAVGLVFSSHLACRLIEAIIMSINKNPSHWTPLFSVHLKLLANLIARLLGSSGVCLAQVSLALKLLLALHISHMHPCGHFMKTSSADEHKQRASRIYNFTLHTFFWENMKCFSYGAYPLMGLRLTPPLRRLGR